LKEKKIRARLDSSNLSTAFLRNRIRLNLIPLLERDFNPKIKNIFAKEAQSLQAAYSYIEKESQKKFNKVATVKRGKVKLNLKKLKRKDSAIKNHLLRLAIKKAKGNLNKISFEHIMSLNRLIKESTGTSKLDLPSNIQAVKEYNSLTIKKKKTSTTSALLPEKLEVPGITKIEDLGLKIKTEIVSKEQYHPKREKSMEYMDLANIKQPIILRFRKRSDKFKPLGMKEEKKLKDFFIDEKIPQDKRDRTLLAESKGKIIWVIGTRIADSVKVTKHTKELIKLNLINI
jgi:tRNA(Ile)-lysidine synthase